MFASSLLRCALCLATAGLATATSLSRADVIITNFNVVASEALVFNDRIGNSRFFSSPNTDSIRISAFPRPTPDTDIFGAVLGSDTFFSLNGSATTASVTHPSFNGYVQSMGFVGQSSTGGGSRNEFTTLFNRANPSIAALLNQLDATPFSITVSNPLSPSVTSVTFQAPDFNKDALPAFLEDVAITGGGLSPTISWTVPTTGAVAPTRVTVQVRIIDADTPTKITAARLVHTEVLPVGQNTFTFIPNSFSNKNVPGFPEGLEEGSRYEMSVNLDYQENGQLKGRARTFFEFTPLPDGLGNVAVYLPSVGPDGIWKFNAPVEAGQIIYIDPEVAIGYDYQIGDGDPYFASVILPDIGDGFFDLYLFNGTDWLFESLLMAGDEFFFGGNGVDRFRVLGIETSAGLNPSDTTAFITGLSFTGDGRFTGSMTPITAEVPEPPTLALMGLVLLGFVALGKRKTG